jgi:hypothetical protein
MFLLMPQWTTVLLQQLPSGQIEPIFRHLLVGLAIFLVGSLLTLARSYWTSVFLQTLAANVSRRVF